MATEVNIKGERRATGVRDALIVAAGLSAAIWVAYFQMCSRLGLFQDDVWMYHIVRFTKDHVLREAFDLTRGYGGEGRPATQVVMVLFTWIGAQLGGLTGLYVLGWILLSIVGVVVYACMRQLFSAHTSFLAAAFFVLFPADAAKFFAVSYMAWAGTILFWTAALLMLKGRVFLGALALASTFLMGEAFILPGFLLPLLLLADGRRELRAAVREAARFIAFYCAVIIPAVVLRLVFAPGRASGALDQFDRWVLVKRVIGSVYFGMVSSLSATWGRLQELFNHGDSAAWTGVFLVFAAFGLVLWALGARERIASDVAQPQAAQPPVRAVHVIAFGLLAWGASYPLYGLYPARFPPTILIGKLSNVHGQAAIGMSALFALLMHTIETRWRGAPAPLLGARLLAGAYLALVSGYFVIVQQRYVEEWHHQLSFWKQLPIAVPDLKADTLIVVEPVGEEITRLEGGSSYDWTLPYLFEFMWHVPSGWPHPPLVINRGFFNTTARNVDGRVDIVGYPTMHPRSFSPKDVIHMRAESGRFYVLDGPGGNIVPRDAAHGYPLFNESLKEPVKLGRGEFLLRAAGLGHVTIAANDYSSGEWKHGVALGREKGKRGRTFYFLLDKPEANPVRVGGLLAFNGAGKARVHGVDLLPQGGMFAVFVTVDRELDPDLDGYPHAIHVLR
jgi:hypothetical protein